MGTRGLLSYRCRRVYYTTYNHRESYPSCLGKSLVSQVPRDRPAYLQWLKEMREKYATIPRSIENHATVPLRRILDQEDHPELNIEDDKPSLDDANELMPDTEKGEPSLNRPTTDVWIEWVYVFDLDYEYLIVQDRYAAPLYFDLYDLKDNLMDILQDVSESTDEEANKASLRALQSSVQSPQIKQIVAKYRAAEDVFEQRESGHVKMEQPPKSPNADGSLEFKLLVTKTRSPLFKKPAFPWCMDLFTKLIKKHYMAILGSHDYSSSPPVEVHQDYQELVYLLLSTATLSSRLLRAVTGDEIVVGRGWEYIGVPKQIADGETRELVTKTLSGIHLSGLLPGSAPKCRYYWLEDVLVVHGGDFDSSNKESFTLAVKELVSLASQESKDHFYGVLFDWKGLFAVVKVDGNTVKHSRLFRIDETQTIGDPESILQPVAHERIAPLLTFSTLALLFEGAALLSLRSHQANEGVFPNDIYMLILDYVDDPETRYSCSLVSRCFRDYASDVFHLADLQLRRHTVKAYSGDAEKVLGFQHPRHGILTRATALTSSNGRVYAGGYNPGDAGPQDVVKSLAKQKASLSNHSPTRVVPKAYLPIIGRPDHSASYLTSTGFLIDVDGLEPALNASWEWEDDAEFSGAVLPSVGAVRLEDSQNL